MSHIPHTLLLPLGCLLWGKFEGKASILAWGWGPTTVPCSQQGRPVPYHRRRVHHGQVVAVEHGGAEGHQEGDREQGEGEALGERRGDQHRAGHCPVPSRRGTGMSLSQAKTPTPGSPPLGTAPCHPLVQQ